MSLIQLIEQRTGLKILEDRQLSMVLFPMNFAHISGAYLGKDQTFLKEEAILLTPTHGRDKWSTLFHELAHATGIEGRLERTGMLRGGFDYMNSAMVRCIEENIAERTAMLLMEHFKIANKRTRDMSIQYIYSYFVPSEFEDHVTKETDKAKEYILTHWLGGLYFNPIEEEMSLMEKIKQAMRFF